MRIGTPDHHLRLTDQGDRTQQIALREEEEPGPRPRVRLL